MQLLLNNIFIYIYLCTLKFRLFIKIKQYILVQSFEICQACKVGHRSADLIFFARTDQTKHLPDLADPTPTDWSSGPYFQVDISIIHAIPRLSNKYQTVDTLQ